MWSYLLPSVVDISGAGIKRKVVINSKDYNIKIEQSTIISNNANQSAYDPKNKSLKKYTHLKDFSN